MKRLLYGCLAILICYAYACKKYDAKNVVVRHSNPALVEKFFTIPDGTSPVVKRVAEYFKNNNEKYNYLTRFGWEQGFAIWDKSIVTHINNSSDTGVMIPLVRQDTKYTSGFIIAAVNSNKITLKLVSGNDYEKYGFGQSSDSLNASYIAGMLMYFNNRLFGDTSFVVTDKRAYNTRSDSSIFTIRLPKPENIRTQATIVVWEKICFTVMHAGDHGNVTGVAPGATADYYYDNGLICYYIPHYVTVPDPPTHPNGGGGDPALNPNNDPEPEPEQPPVYGGTIYSHTGPVVEYDPCVDYNRYDPDCPQIILVKPPVVRPVWTSANDEITLWLSDDEVNSLLREAFHITPEEVDPNKYYFFSEVFGWTETKLPTNSVFNESVQNTAGYYRGTQVLEFLAAAAKNLERKQRQEKIEEYNKAAYEWARVNNLFILAYEVSPLSAIYDGGVAFENGQYLAGVVLVATGAVDVGPLFNHLGKAYAGIARSIAARFTIAEIWNQSPVLRGILLEIKQSAHYASLGYEWLAESSQWFRAIDYYNPTTKTAISLKTVNATANVSFENIQRNIRDLIDLKNAGKSVFAGVERPITTLELHIGVPQGYDISKLKDIKTATEKQGIKFLTYVIQ